MNLPLAPVIAIALGGAAALLTLAVPADVLGDVVMASGIPAVIAAAEPPLGATARALIAAGLGGLVTAFAWLALFVLIGTRGVSLSSEPEPEAETDGDELLPPVLRRADAHPDAPPRPPLFAMRDLGTPFLEVRASEKEEGLRIGKVKPVAHHSSTLAEPAPAAPVPAAPNVAAEMPSVRPAIEPLAAERPAAGAPVQPEAAGHRPVERPLPQDFSQPLAAFDPDAIPDVPLPPPAKLPPLRPKPRAPVYEARERFEVFELTPPNRQRAAPAPAAVAPSAGEPAEEPIMRPETEASVHALLERLERGMIRQGLATGREASPPPSPRAPMVDRRRKERGLEDTLVTLRNLARRA